MTSPAISITAVDKVFNPGRKGEVTALTGIDLDVAQGELVSLIGPSGCGKSTLLRLVGDLETPSAGTVEVNGKPARQARLDHDYGIAFQQAGLLRLAHRRGQCRAAARAARLATRVSRRERSRELLELVGPGRLRRGTVRGQLSGGMQQRVAIARALADETSGSC